MKYGPHPRSWPVLLLVLIAAAAIAKPPQAATSAFDAYARLVETSQHRPDFGFGLPTDDARLRAGEMVIENVGSRDLPGALLHHWRATVFVPGATAADFERLMRNYADYPKRFAPQVLDARVLEQHGDRYRVLMRVRQKHLLTVVMDTAYDVNFGRFDSAHGYSTSRSTRVTEIEDAGTPGEHALGPDEEHGFLWRQNTYWSYEQRGGGLFLRVESISLTGPIPRGLGWAVGPYVESVPRESLVFTLGRVRSALQK